MEPEDTPGSFWVDRVEGDGAVLHGSSGIQVELPMNLLPQGSVEGSWLTLSL